MTGDELKELEAHEIYPDTALFEYYKQQRTVSGHREALKGTVDAFNSLKSDSMTESQLNLLKKVLKFGKGRFK